MSHKDYVWFHKSYVTIVTHDTHKETIKDITIGTKQFNCDQLFKEGRSADPCGVVVVPQWPGWLEYNCIQSSHGPAPRQCRGAGAKMASWQLPPLTTGQEDRTEADGMETLSDCVGIIFQNEWGNPSGLVKNLLMWRFSIIYVWKWYGFYLARSCCVCCLMLTHDIVHTKVSTPDVFVTTDKREPGPRPPVTLSTWVQGHEHLQLAHSSTAWRGKLKKRDKITPTHCGFAHSSLTCSAAESYLPCRIGPTHVLIWAQMRNWLW